MDKTTSPAIKGHLTIYNSRRDTFGNCYWAFTYEDHTEGKRVEGTISGGESNLTCAARYIDPLTTGRVSVSSQELPIREFNRMAKAWPYAGCTPEDQIAAYVNRSLEAQGPGLAAKA